MASVTSHWRNGTLSANLPNKRSRPKNNHQNLKNDGNLNNVRDKKPFTTTAAPNSGSAIPSFWDAKIPRKKRSKVIYKNMTPMKKFQNRMYRLWRLHGNPNDESEDVLLEHNLTTRFIPSGEIGLGAVLLKPENPPTPEA